MKKVFYSLFAIGIGVAFYACTKNSDLVGGSTLKTNANQLVASDAVVDNAVETTNYETDVFSTATPAVATYNSGLKGADLLAADQKHRFRGLFDQFPGFKHRYEHDSIPGFTFTATNGTYPVTMTMDYGDSTVLANGKVLRGSITVVISAAPNVSGSTRTVTFTNFSVDTMKISGTIVKIRTKDPMPKFTETSDLTVTYKNGTVVTRKEDKQRAWTAGYLTQFDPSDDIMEITGSVKVSDSNGNSYSKIITSPLIKTGTCKYITKGVVEYKNSNGKFATIDFGDGTCDNVATKTTQDGTSTITLGKEEGLREMGH